MVWKASEDLDEDKKKDEEGQTSSQGQVLSGQSAGGSGGQSAAGTAAKDKTSSGSFTNLQSYVGANTGADTAMVGRVGNTVGNAQNSASDAGNNLSTKADETISAGTVTDTKGVTETFKSTDIAQTPATPAPTTRSSTPSATPATTSTFGGRPPKQTTTTPSATPATGGRPPVQTTAPVAPPTSTGKTVNDFTVDDVSALWNATYGGPDSWNDTQLGPQADAATKSYKKVDDYGRLAGGDISDRSILLDDTFATAGQQYGKGERMLDSYLLGAGSEAGTLQGIADTASNYGTEFEGLKSWIGEQAAAGRATTDKTRKDVREAGTGAEGRFEGEFTKLAGEGGALESKNNQFKAIEAAALKGDKSALKQYGLSDVAIGALTKEGMTPAQIKNFLNTNIDFKLGDVTNESDVGTYSQLMKLLTGADKEGLVKQDFTDFSKGKGATFATNEGVNQALEDLAGLQGKEAELKQINTEQEARYNKAVQLLSKIGSDYSMPMTPAQIKEAAALTGVPEQKIQNAVDKNEKLNLDLLLTAGPQKKLGNVLSPEQVAQYEKLQAFLKTPGKDFTAAADTPEMSLKTGGAQFDNWAPPTAQEAINDLSVNKTPQAYSTAYQAITAGWPAEARAAFPQHEFNVFADRLGNQLGTAIAGLMDAITAAGMAGEDAANFIKNTANTLHTSRNPQDVIKDAQNALYDIKKTGAVAGSSVSKANQSLLNPIIRG